MSDCSLDLPAVSLFQLLSSLVAGSMVGPRTEFVTSFMSEVIHCGEHISSAVLQFAPIPMVGTTPTGFLTEAPWKVRWRTVYEVTSFYIE